MKQKRNMAQKLSNIRWAFGFLLVSTTIFFPMTSFAQGLIPCEITKCTFCDFFTLIQTIYKFIIFDLVPPLAIGLVAFAGFLWLISGVNQAQAAQAMKLAQGVAIGLIIVYTSWVIINFIILALFQKAGPYEPAKWYNPNSWFATISCEGLPQWGPGGP